MSRFNVLPVFANLFSKEGFLEGGYTDTGKIVGEKVDIIGFPDRVDYPVLTIKNAKNRTSQKSPDAIRAIKFDFPKLKRVNSDGNAVFSSVGSLPQDSRYVVIDVKNIRIHDNNADWSKLTYDDQKGLMQNIIHCELEYFKTRFLNDAHFYKFLANSYNEIKYDENLYKLFFDHNVEVTIYSCLMWNALTRYQRNEELAFSKEYAIQAIRDTMPKAPTQNKMKKTIIQIAKDVDDSKFYLTDAPLLTPIQNFLSNDSFINHIDKETWGIYINTAVEAGKRATNFALKFGKKHVAMFELVNKVHYNMYRINQTPYKFKSLKKELGI